MRDGSLTKFRDAVVTTFEILRSAVAFDDKEDISERWDGGFFSGFDAQPCGGMWTQELEGRRR